MAFNSGSHSHSRRSSFGDSHRSSFNVHDMGHSEARPWPPAEAVHAQRPVLIARERSEALPRISTSMQSLTHSVRSLTFSVGHTLTSTVPSFSERAKQDGLGSEPTLEGMPVARSNTIGTMATAPFESAQPWCQPQVEVGQVASRD
jgi:hypothetical protein